MRTYQAEERAEAVALAASLGPKKAALQLGYPIRTVSHWTHGDTHRADLAPVMQAAEATIAARLTAAHRVALDAVLAGLADPKSRLGDRAAALRTIGEQLALAEGRATSRTESTNLNVNLPAGSPLAELSAEERAELRAYIEGIPDPLALTEGADRG
jgi:hypothetical protein